MLYGHIDEYTKLTYSAYAEFAYQADVDKVEGMGCQGDNLLAEEDTWKAILEPSLCEDAAAVEILARLLLTIRKAIESGPEGAMRASRTLLYGVELIYLYTNAHKAALKL